jgi:hypothetical protein
MGVPRYAIAEVPKALVQDMTPEALAAFKEQWRADKGLPEPDRPQLPPVTEEAKAKVDKALGRGGG